MNKPSLFCVPAILTALAGGALPCSVAEAQVVEVAPSAVGRVMFLKLDTSEVVVGTVTAVQRDFIVLQSDVFGEIRVPRSRIASARGFDPDSPMTAEEVEEFIDLPEEAPAAPVAAPAEVPEEKPAVVWENRFEAGLTGSEGNSQNVNFSALLSLQRTTSRDEVLSLTNYRYTQTEREDTANRFDTLLRYDWRFAEGSPWSLFGQGQYEYDQFQDWDYRVSLFGGVGYRLIENETTTLRVRAGAGASREFGGGNDAWEPEGLIGFDLAHQLAKNQRITAYGTLFPSLDDFGEFRSVSGAAYEVDLTDNGDLALRLGAEHRYDTQPGDAKRSDLDYFARVVFRF